MALAGQAGDLERVLADEVIDEVAICLPFSQWGFLDGIAYAAEEAGKIVRVPMDVLTHPFASGRVEDLDGTPVYSLVSGPDRTLALWIKRGFDIVVSGIGLLALSPLFLVIGWAVRRDGGPALFRQTPRRPARPPLPDAQVPFHVRGRGGASGWAGGRQRARWARLQDDR